ncbi:assimilatory sulfite reductase (NADPH) hemoprotein subunit [Thiofilum flexile]|uniref:assimilatory sulfite reductase (NADPH) hemoprotein subunit n=1 Tax=Thiofilum flexile TaxID=125627 RepID=UPI0003649F94|nr:assimilatory sulfite reductase (NADPH) hemoprotein subunit [Thiofilum flexile]
MTKPTPKTFNVMVAKPSEVEHIKDKSRYLRGTLVESFADPITGAIAADDVQLIKFHGAYIEDDRDLRLERQERKLEPAYEFMIRVRVPGGDLNAQQWLKLTAIADQYANKTLRITTRQAMQFHGILKFDLKKSIQMMDEAVLDSIAACGDVNRNVMCTPDASLSAIHAQVFPYAQKISEHLLPRTRAYHEIWLDQPEGRTLVAGGEPEELEPLYGKHYLPRKFKVAIAIPPYNDTDVYINDIGLVAIAEGEKLVGFNVAVGGGLGMTFGREDTYPRLADTIGFCTPDQVLDVCYQIVSIQRDYGNRTDRKLSRFKYTLDQYGLEWFKAELNQRLGWDLAAAKPVEFITTGDQFGWRQTADGRWHLTLRVEYGRVKDTEEYQLKTALAQLSQYALDHAWTNFRLRLSANQNLVIANVEEADKAVVETLLTRYHYQLEAQHISGLRRNSIACVSLNTCPQAMAEAERYMPSLLDKLEPTLRQYGLLQEDIKIRMTGCPNGCGRSVMAEIGLIGKSPGRYNLYLGGDFQGERLNKLYRENLDEKALLSELDQLLGRYSVERLSGEHFGDFVIRAGIIRATLVGREFHQ